VTFARHSNCRLSFTGDYYALINISFSLFFFRFFAMHDRGDFRSSL